MFKRGLWTPFVAIAALSVGACDSTTDPVGPVVEIPAQPVVQSVTQSGDALVVTWAAVTGATAYDLERSSGSTFSSVASDLSGTSYTDGSVEAGTSYAYRVIAKNSAGSSTPSSTVAGEIGLKQATLSGTISDARTLDADTTYIITGIVVVDEGASLTIPAGTLLLGNTKVQPSAVIVRVGGQIFSNGTAAAPVVFTSDKPEGSRARGDWGGVVLNGASQCNFPAADCVGEGASGPYGGDVLDDNSGVMTYTRVEFAGYEVSFGNELNALTFNGVGSGTELHHLQAHYGSDDGFEWFGGTVDLKYAVSTGNSDDSFDYSTGWSGRGQFWIVQHDPGDADTGFEVDGNEEDYNAEPFTDPTIYNLTLVGKGVDGAGGTAGESTNGIKLRRGTAGDIYNAIVIGFGSSGVDIDNVETVGRYTIQNSIIALNAADLDADADAFQDSVALPAWNNRIGTDPLLADAFNRDAPDFRPGADSPALSGFATPPSDGFFEPVNYIGAVDPSAATQWFEGWTTWVKN
jgi:hypothetical protein